MTSKNNRIETLLKNGYELDFSALFEQAFTTYKKVALTTGLVLILMVCCILLVGFSVVVLFFSKEDFETIAQGPNFMTFEIEHLALYWVSISVLSGLISPLNAGIYKLAHLAEKNKPFSVANVLDYYKTSRFLPLFIASFIISLVGVGVNLLLEYNGVPFYGVLFTYTVSFLTFLTLPLIAFSNVSGTDAIHFSIQLVIKQPLILLGLLIVSIMASMLGLLVLCLGVFFTLPFYYTMVYTIYSAILPITEEATAFNHD